MKNNSNDIVTELIDNNITSVNNHENEVVQTTDDILNSEFQEIPMEIINNKIGFSGEIIPKKLLDPYISESSTEQMFPMSYALFNWLMNSIRIMNPIKLPFLRPLHSSVPGSNGSSNNIFRFDRLHIEGTVCMSDKSFIILHVLHGIIDNASAINDEINGVPETAARFITINTLKKLKNGLTILVFDVLSRVSRVIRINESSLFRAAEAFHTNSENIPFIAKKIVENAKKCISIVRVAAFFTDAVFTTSFLVKKEEIGTYNGKFSKLTTCKYLGRKYVVNNAGSINRINNLQLLLTEQNL